MKYISKYFLFLLILIIFNNCFSKQNIIKNIRTSDKLDSVTTRIVLVLSKKTAYSVFTLDNKLYGPDHSSSLPVKELKNFVNNLRFTKIILGKRKLKRSKAENNNKKIVRKSLVAKKIIRKGEIFLSSNLTCKRPGTGLSPYLLKKIIGTKSKFNFGEDKLIKLK